MNCYKNIQGVLISLSCKLHNFDADNELGREQGFLDKSNRKAGVSLFVVDQTSVQRWPIYYLTPF